MPQQFNCYGQLTLKVKPKHLLLIRVPLRRADTASRRGLFW